MTDEYNDILDKIHTHGLQFLGLIDMERDRAIEKLKTLKFNTYNSLKASVNYHAKKPFININPVNTNLQKNKPVESVVNPKSKITTFKQPSQYSTEANKYKIILDANTDPSTIDQKYIPLRNEYLSELADLESDKGCSSCQRGKLKRKFIEKLTALDKANSES